MTQPDAPRVHVPGWLAAIQVFIISGIPTQIVVAAVLLLGLRLDPFEGTGEVQTPVLGSAAERLSLGDRVYFRHIKAGELCERFDRLFLVTGNTIRNEVPTYRGEGYCFG